MDENGLEKCVSFLRDALNKKSPALRNDAVLSQFIEKIYTMLVISDMDLVVKIKPNGKLCMFCSKIINGINIGSAIGLQCSPSEHYFCSKNCLKKHALLCTKNTLLDLEYVRCPSCRVSINIDLISDAFEGHIEDIQRDACDRALKELLNEEEKENLQAKFNCGICYGEFKVEESVTLECDHRFCFPCIKMHMELLIESAQVSDEHLRCPTCVQPLTAYEIEDIVGPQLYEKYEKFRLRGFKLSAEEDENSILFQCRGVDCEYLCIIEKGVGQFTCPKCNYKCCPMCKKDIHDGMTCEQFEKYLKENDKESKAFEQLLRREGLLRCPVCGAVVERIDGCEFMVCSSSECQGMTYFCYNCGRKLERDHEPHRCKVRELPENQRNMYRANEDMIAEVGRRGINPRQRERINRLGVHADGVERLLGRPAWR
ncbi:unnamed protein product [Blepharisma stoltei]|uniref:RBR-type E3 ubiquitin transferase n=1 Tax=Blepharisma stoltei TaxID=1481888 RepID=A0AAU9J0F3_9CILI|nr:unnamed protein product [Blepharisma stoltei]